MHEQKQGNYSSIIGGRVCYWGWLGKWLSSFLTAVTGGLVVKGDVLGGSSPLEGESGDWFVEGGVPRFSNRGGGGTTVS